MWADVRLAKTQAPLSFMWTMCLRRLFGEGILLASGRAYIH